MNITKENKKIIFAENLNTLMKIHGLSRKDLCKALGIPRETLRSWLIAIDYPPVEKMAILANYFKVDIASLIEKHNIFDNLNKNEIKMIHDMQHKLFKEGMPIIYIQMFTTNAVLILKYIKDYNIYGGIENE